MSDKSLVKYRVLPSDDEDWIIIELVNKKVKVDLEKKVLTYRYDCVPHNIKLKDGIKLVCCSYYCCYCGCYITPVEIEFIENILNELKRNYLPKDSIELLNKFKDEFYLPEEYDINENLFKTRCVPTEPPSTHEVYEYSQEPDSYEMDIEKVPETHCVFLMENGLCSIHKYLTYKYNNNTEWALYKFNICTTFPLDIRVTRNETALDAPWPDEKRVDDDLCSIKMMEDFDNFLYYKMDCINLSDEKKRLQKIPYIIDSLRYAIETRLGRDMWLAINDYAKKYRQQLQLPLD